MGRGHRGWLHLRHRVLVHDEAGFLDIGAPKAFRALHLHQRICAMTLSDEWGRSVGQLRLDLSLFHHY